MTPKERGEGSRTSHSGRGYVDLVPFARYLRAVERRVMPPVRKVTAPVLARQVSLRLFEDHAFGATSWLGVPIWKEPSDLWTYQQLMVELRPDLVVETGTLFGGSALYLATLCDLLGRGRVMTVDVAHLVDHPVPEHQRIEYLLGSSTSDAVISRIRAAAQSSQTVLVILDSDHRYVHVRDELHLYGPLVTPGSYMIVEDTAFDYTASTDFGPGPAAAVRDFLGRHHDFKVHAERERYLVTQNPGGYLRRTSACHTPQALPHRR